MNIGLSRIESLAADDASLDLIAASWLLTGDKPHRLSYTFKSYTRYSEQRHSYAVLRSDVAALDMTSELKRIARTRSDKVETGGLIFGEIDDAHQVIWVDSVSGPPPDSTSSDMQFLCGTAGTKKLNAFKSAASGKSSRFIGIWHTHPTVSYTHLDVYKRQLHLTVWEISPDTLKVLRAMVRSKGEDNAARHELAKWMVGAGAVSYTHLDVYKRQTFEWLEHQLLPHCQVPNGRSQPDPNPHPEPFSLAGRTWL